MLYINTFRCNHACTWLDSIHWPVKAEYIHEQINVQYNTTCCGCITSELTKGFSSVNNENVKPTILNNCSYS